MSGTKDGCQLLGGIVGLAAGVAGTYAFLKGFEPSGLAAAATYAIGAVGTGIAFLLGAGIGGVVGHELHSYLTRFAYPEARNVFALEAMCGASLGEGQTMEPHYVNELDPGRMSCVALRDY